MRRLDLDRRLGENRNERERNQATPERKLCIVGVFVKETGLSTVERRQEQDVVSVLTVKQKPSGYLNLCVASVQHLPVDVVHQHEDTGASTSQNGNKTHNLEPSTKSSGRSLSSFSFSSKIKSFMVWGTLSRVIRLRLWNRMSIPPLRSDLARLRVPKFDGDHRSRQRWLDKRCQKSGRFRRILVKYKLSLCGVRNPSSLFVVYASHRNEKDFCVFAY